MYETMYNANGVGLAAPQIGKSIRLFIIDTAPFLNIDENEIEGIKVESIKQTFINPVIIQESGDSWSFEEGCLSIPHIREDVKRKSDINIQFYDENFTLNKKSFSGIGSYGGINQYKDRIYIGDDGNNVHSIGGQYV